jgi:dihydroorotate dehydrogenase
MYRRAIFPLFARLDAETIHDRTLRVLERASQSPSALRLIRRLAEWDDPRLAVELWGLQFRNPLGIAAGLDKNGVAVPALLSLGWGHVEVGTVTPLPQSGNARPRVFRLVPDQALINRMGFPGAGSDAVRSHLARRSAAPGVVGVNIGANKASVEAGTAARDYRHALAGLYDVADYLTINVSSPNTARLRDLQGRSALAGLIGEVMSRRAEMPVRKPVLVKLAPDLSSSEIDDIVEVSIEAGIDGIVATNTTVSRPSDLKSLHRSEAGGLSGRPVTVRSTEVVRYLYRRTEGRMPIVAAGGVFTPQDAFTKLQAGASLVQVYTGFIYEGPGLARRINRGLVWLMEQHGFANIAAIIGVAA